MALMDPLSLQFGPYSFLGVLLSIPGLISTIFLWRFEHKTPAAWYLVAALAGFTGSMIAMFLTASVVLWGGVFWPTQDAWVIFSMAAVIGLIYHYPEKDTSGEAWLAQGLGIGAVVLAFGYSFYYVGEILVNHQVNQSAYSLYPYLMPVMLLLTLGLAVRRTVRFHRAAVGCHAPQRGALAALFRPHVRARAMRNISVALSVGLVQGLASGLSAARLLPMPFDLYTIGLALLALIILLVNSCWDYVTRQPSLMVKLIGLVLVTLLGVLGTVGIFSIHSTVVQSETSRLLEVEMARQAIQSDDLSALPAAIEAIVARPDSEGVQPAVRLVYARPKNRAQGALLAEIQNQVDGITQPAGIWGTYYENYLVLGRPRQAANLYFGNHPAGSYKQYVGYTFRTEPSKSDAQRPEIAQTYETLFSLSTVNAPVHQAGLFMTSMVLISCLLILMVFPLFFHAGIITPLNHLLQGVTQANAGDLNVAVPISQDDEIGFLTRSFNAMIVSIRTQAAARQQKETALQELTDTLEQRIAGRTRELAVLYEISAVASQAQTIETLLNSSLTQAMTALDSDLGAAFLLEPPDRLSSEPLSEGSLPLPEPSMKRIACQSLDDHDGCNAQFIPPELPAAHEMFNPLFKEHESLLVLNIAEDTRLPEEMRRLGERSLLVAPLRAPDALSLHDRVLGALALIHRAGSTFSAEEVALFGSIADQVGISVQSSRLRQQAVALEERQRLARDLHDSVTQVLYGLVTLAEAGQARLESGCLEGAKPTFERIAATARQALNEMRLFVHRLRPPELEQHGLAAALNQRVAAVEGWSGARIRLLVDESIHLPAETEAGLYLIAQEALNNALRHAHAHSITLKLQGCSLPPVFFTGPEGAAGQRTLLEISDDGCGFDLEQVNRCGLGLAHMTERAHALQATIEIITRPGEGTRVKVVV